MALTLVSASLLVLTSAISVCASESHTVNFDNRCGYGTPQLIQNGQVLTTTSYTSTGQLSSAIAYLQTGGCGFNGENCTLLELTMTNPVVVGGGSSADISLITPHTFSVPSSLAFYDGCDGVNATCDSPSCSAAFRAPDDTWVQIACQENNVNLLITFCPDGSASSSPGTTTSTQVKTTTGHSQTKTSPSTTSSHAAPSSTVTTNNPSSPSSPSPSPSTTVPVCKHKRSERRALNVHRKRGSGRRFHS